MSNDIFDIDDARQQAERASIGNRFAQHALTITGSGANGELTPADVFEDPGPLAELHPSNRPAAPKNTARARRETEPELPNWTLRSSSKR